MIFAHFCSTSPMHVGTIIGIIGLALSTLGGLWYWRITQLAAAFAGTATTGNLDRTAKFAIGLACFGLILFLIGMTAVLLAKDEDR
jgi:hypothetical protein